MSSKSPNLKINIGADTSDFQKGAKEAKQGIRDFEKVTGGALDSVASKFGVNTGKIQEISSALKGLGAKMTEAGGAGAKAFGSLLSSITPVAGAIAGLGIGAVVTAFKLLNAEAENFKSTVQGANIELAKAAYLDTYKQILHDLNGNVGKAVAETESGWSKFWGRAWASVKNVGVNFLTSGDMGGAAAKSLIQGKIATAGAEEAARLANDIYEIQRKQSDKAVEIAELDAQIAEYKRIAFDSTVSTTEQAAALAKAEELIRSKYEGPEGSIALATRLADDMRDMNNLASSTPEQIDNANRARITANSLVRQENEEIKALSRRQTAINNAIDSEAAARAKAAKAAADTAAAAQKIADSRAALAEWSALAQPAPIAGPGMIAQPEAKLKLTPPDPPEIAEFVRGLDTLIQANLGDTSILIGFEYDRSQLIDISREVQGIVTSIAETTGDIIGGLVGDLMTGGDAWGNFANAAISAFGDMAISVGKMAIATGTATLGIKAALESLNGWVAIAAGVALVALGTAVKTGLSNIASGNYNTSANVASSASVASPDFTTSEITVNVTGTLKANGNELITVIQNTEQKNGYTT